MMTGDTGLRQAALLLHASAPVERSWLLAQLEQHERDALAALLDELKRLGLPADARLLELAATLPEARFAVQSESKSELKLEAKIEEKLTAQTRSTTKYCAEDQRHRTYLQQTPARTLISILQAEPVLLIALVLRCTSGHWQAALVKRLDVVNRRALEKRLADPEDFPAALKTAVLAALSERVGLMMASTKAFDKKSYAQPDGELEVDSNVHADSDSDSDSDAIPDTVFNKVASYCVSIRSRRLACLDSLRRKLALSLRHIVRLMRTHGKMKAGS